MHTAAWSGLGMVRNCCGGNTTMPAIFGRTLATVNKNSTWDFKSWTADVLVINLGTAALGLNCSVVQCTAVY